MAPKMPRIVANTAVAAPTWMLFFRAACIGSLASICSYHLVVNSLNGKAMYKESLKEKNGRNSTGT